MSERAPVPAPGDLPEELREREQWLMWDTSADKPRKPLNEDGYAASWTDPDEWLSFERAHEIATDIDTRGMGYVFARTNDDYPRGLYGGLDLDGCLKEDGKGRPKEWLPSLQVFIDAGAYIERSPSGTGLHIPLVGFERPEWWSNTHFTDEGHEGIEAYGSKFFTVTGECIEASGDEVADTGEWVERWLAQAHKSITGEDPRTPSSKAGLSDSIPRGSSEANGGQHERALTEADIREALDHINPDIGYSEWRNIGYALENYFRSSTARTLFEEWSRGGSKWDSRAPDLVDDIIHGSKSTTNDERTIASVVYHAKRGGWSLPSPAVNASMNGGSTSTSHRLSGEHVNEHTSTYELALTPESVRALAGLGEDGTIADLSDRQKAAYVWTLIRQSDAFHIRVRRDNASLWSYDTEAGIWKPEGERALRHAARRALGALHYGPNVLAELKAQARSDPSAEVEPDTFGVEPGVVALENGLLNLDRAATADGGALRELRPEDYTLARLPVEYNPDAEYDEWEEYVTEWAEDGRANTLQEYVGYCLHIGAMPIHRSLLLVGSGANGKGTFLHVVRALLGAENTTSIELQTLANERDAVADFYGSIANIDDDLSARKLGAGLGMFKKLVGGDRVRARHLYESGFEFDATGKHLYAANEVPKVNIPDDDEAFWRRWLLVEFPNHYPPSKRDGELRERLSNPEALSGVLNWAIEGRRRLLAQGHFTNEEHYAQQKRERWQAWGDSVDTFISECVTHDPEAPRLTTAQAHRRYEAWCRENNEEPMGQQQLTNTLKKEDVGYGRHRIDGASERGYDALGLSDDVPALHQIHATSSTTDTHDSRQDSLL